MKRSALMIALLLANTAVSAAPWTYRGTLNDGGKPANGTYDLRVTLLNQAKTETVYGPLTLYDVKVVNGNFVADVDFGSDLSAAPAMALKTEVQQGGSGFVALGEATPFDPKAVLAGVCWDTEGNAGTNPTTNFIGTIDNQPLVLRANNLAVLSIFPTQAPPNYAQGTPNFLAGSVENKVDATKHGQVIAGGGLTGTSCGGFGRSCGNITESDFATISGGYSNFGIGVTSVISGGYENNASGHVSAIGGGLQNSTANSYSTVGGGAHNHATELYSTVSGGQNNAASEDSSNVSGGAYNNAMGEYSTVSGGFYNDAKGKRSTVSGGSGNKAYGERSTVGGGNLNCAGGDNSWAGGYNAKIRPGNEFGDGTCVANSATAHGDNGTFVWADDQGSELPTPPEFISTGPRQFLVRAQGGVAINGAPPNADTEFSIYGRTDDAFDGFVEFRLTPTPALNGNTGEGIEIGVSKGGAGGNDAGFRIAHRSNTLFADRFNLNSDGSVVIRSNTTGTNTGVTMAANGGSWSNLSDRRLKQDIVPVDALDVLDKVASLPMATWSYIAQGSGVRHMGPMAQDFAASFKVGENDTSISTIDADGVALAAIQGLNVKLDAQNAALQAQVEALLARVASLESVITSRPEERAP